MTVPPHSIAIAESESVSREREESNGDSSVQPLNPFAEVESPLSSRKAFLSWLLLCYSVCQDIYRKRSTKRSFFADVECARQTGPTSSMTFTYIPVSLQTMANLLGHEPGRSAKKCATRGAIRCVVKFGSGEVDYNSYV